MNLLVPRCLFVSLAPRQPARARKITRKLAPNRYGSIDRVAAQCGQRAERLPVDADNGPKLVLCPFLGNTDRPGRFSIAAGTFKLRD